MTSRYAIRTSNLRKEYGSNVAVDSLTLTLETGSIYGFLGPNGAGKTTTMHMLTTLAKPTAGTARIAGHPLSNREAVLSHIGYLPEDPPVYPELTGREQLEYWAEFRELDGSASDRIDSLLRRFELIADADKYIHEYSKGMRQKLGIIHSMLHEPAVLFLDEPTSGLDPRGVRTFRELLRDCVDDGATVFLSTHVLPVIDDLADEIGVLHDGRLVAEGPPDELKQRIESNEEPTLENAFLEITMDSPVDMTA